MSQETETSEIDINLSDHRQELADAIISAYPRIPQLTTMIRNRFNKNPDIVAGGETLDVKVSNWIQWAISQSKEKELLKAVYQGNPNDKDLKIIIKKILPSLLETPLYDKPNTKKWHQRITLRRLGSTVLTSIGLTTFIVVLRLLGVFQDSELLLFDRMMRLSQLPQPEKLDERLLIVQITSQDIKHYSKKITSKNGASLADEVIYNLLKKLLEKKPRVIGLDLYRSADAEKPLTNLINKESTNKNLVFICKFPNKKKNENFDANASHDPPPDVPLEQVGLSDFLEDNDGVIRRQIIKMGTPNDATTKDLTKCQNPSNELMESFSFKLAQKYLEKENNDRRFSVKENEKLISNNITLEPLENSIQGGYAQKNLNGYQIMLNYRYAE